MKTPTPLKESGTIRGMLNADSLQDLFLEQLHQVYQAEKQMLSAFPAIINSCVSPEFKKILKEHLESSGTQLMRLDEIYSLLNATPEQRTCFPLRGFLEEAEALINNTSEASTRDLALISVLQKIEHYEMASYDNLKTLALIQGKVSIADLLQASFDEEEEADEKISSLAQDCIRDLNNDFIAYND